MKPTTLPVYYYLDHFVEMLHFVEKTYGVILTEEHRSFTARFRGLSKDAHCLLIRMVNRRGAIFNRALFKYPEITDLGTAARDLIECGRIGRA
jgi:DNA polymerase III subunit epsilon